MTYSREERKEALNKALLFADSMRYQKDDIEHWLKLYEHDYPWDTDIDIKYWAELMLYNAEEVVRYLREAGFTNGIKYGMEEARNEK